MNAALLNAALAGRKQYIEATSAHTGMGTGLAKATAKSVSSSSTKKRNIYEGQFVEKSDTGFTGLFNLGATCYLNTLLQSLYMTPEFRQAIFKWKYDEGEHGEEKYCIPLQLQKLFAYMQLSARGAVQPKPLVQTFGWEGAEMYVQHDIVEVSNVIFHHLEKASAVGGKELNDFMINSLFGHTKDYIECQKCKVSRDKPDRFSSIALGIKGLKDLDACFDAYHKPELLEGVNCPTCQEKYNHLKGSHLAVPPYILMIQLRRFDMNWNTLQRIKLRDQIQLPAKMDMSRHIHGDKKGEKVEYELYSICIHTGGAMGGHYYAYTKDFSTGKWYKFDDSTVTEIPEDFIPSLFKWGDDKKGDEEKKPEGEKKPEKAAAAASTSGLDARRKRMTQLRLTNPLANGYVLFYRQIGEKNVNKVDDACVPEELKKEIDEQDVIYKEQKKEWERQKNLIRFNVKYDEGIHIVEVKKDDTMGVATRKVYDQIKNSPKEGEEAIEMPKFENVRLREILTLQNLPGVPYDGYVDDLVGQFNFKDHKVFMLEVRKEGEEFEEYEADQLSFQVYQYDEKADDYKDRVVVGVPEHATLGRLRKGVAQRLKVEPINVRLAYATDDMATLLVDDSESLMKDLRLVKGDHIHVEVVEDHTKGDSKMMKKFSDELNMIRIVYNKLGSKEMNQILDVDMRISVDEFRKILAEKLGVDGNTFKIWRTQELKDGKKSLAQSGVRKGSEIYLEEGTPLKLGEYLFKIFLWSPPKKKEKPQPPKAEGKEGIAAAAAAAAAQAPEDPAIFIGDMTVNRDWDMKTFKSKLEEKFGDALPKASFMRVRDRLGMRLTNVYVDNKTLGQNCKGIRDLKDVCIQKSVKADEVVTDEHLLVNLTQWKPEEFKLGTPFEIPIRKDSKLDDVKKIASEVLNIPLEFVQASRALAYKMKNIENIPLLDWAGSAWTSRSTITTKPWKMRHGDFLLAKDSRKKERIEKKDDGSVKRNFVVEEKPFQIHDAKTRKELKEKREAQEAAYLAELEDAREAAEQRVAALKAEMTKNKRAQE